MSNLFKKLTASQKKPGVAILISYKINLKK